MPALPLHHKLELILLGGLDVRLNGCSIAGVSYNKMRALLAYLAVERIQDHRREVLAELLWCGNEAATARGNLRRTLSDLRRVLELPSGKTLFSTGKHTIRFVPDAYIDVLEFTAIAPSCIATPAQAHCGPCIDQMERMAALYRGEFMEGYSLPDCTEFEGWLQTRRESLRRHALALLERLSNCHEQAGSYGRALPFALRYTELEPWDEEGHRRAMRLYALIGQHSAALGQYDYCVRLLKTELGASPNTKTRKLAESIRLGEYRPGSCGATGKPPATALPPPATERRQVTVLYCELCLAGIDDPDEAIKLLCAPQARCAEIIRQFSGYIVQAYGGGLLAYFGYPKAHEYAARHAVQAALAATGEAVHGMEIRAGVHTGLLIAGGDPLMPDTSGRTTRLAILLRHGATPGEVVISQDTFGIVAGYFDCRSLGVQHLPGTAQALEKFGVTGESGAHSRLEAAARLTPLAGRNTEINRLLGWWQKAAQGSRHAVLIQGEAGIGKSRLLLALKQRLAGQPHAICELRCLPEFGRSPFYPLIFMLEGLLGHTHDDSPKTRLARLSAHLEAYCPELAQDAAAVLAHLLFLPHDDHFTVLPPQPQQERTIAILTALLQSLAAQQPLLLIAEDLHWADPSTLEVLARFAGQTRAMLAVFTARPEFVPPWNNVNETRLTLGPLADDEVSEMAASLRVNLPSKALNHLVKRADGVPLFIEEMAKFATADHQPGIPATLHDLLSARMDDMGNARYTAQLAATLGREFDLNLLRKAFPGDAASLALDLDALLDAGLVLKMNETTCRFKHALLQEAVYQSQTRSARQAAHLRIARVLQDDFPDVVAARPELLAHHLSSSSQALASA